MNSIQLSETDLRLLLVLDSLLSTHEVARTAQFLGVSPSAISHSLKQLRERLNDRVFVRVKGRLQPTPLASALQSNLHAGLLQLSQVLSQELEFDPQTSARTMSVAAPDHPLFTRLPPLLGRLRESAPNLTFRLRFIGPTVLNDLADGSLDLMLSGTEVEAAIAFDHDLMRSRIIAEPFYCIMRPDHPAARSDPVDPDAYLKASHVLVSTLTGEADPMDDVLALAGFHRRIVATVPSFLTAAWIAVETDLIATLPATVAMRAVERTGVVARTPPFEMPESVAYMWWHPRFQSDPAHVWWRKMIAESFAPRRRSSESHRT
jgi:DNA-binding transcriptional LysR family regulator